MIQVCNHTRQVADAVIVAVGETAQVQLVDDPALPPIRVHA
jgi:hypothetical protein